MPFAGETKSKVIVINTNELDFVKNPKDYQLLKDLLQKKYTEKMNFI